MSEFFIQEKQLGRATRTIVKNEKGHSLFLRLVAGEQRAMHCLFMP